jgi:type II secretion system protein G
MFLKKSRTFGRGFTLIELLIVVAIIAILAAIAVPNFLEAQTRAKISRSKADMRTITTGLETYHIDHNAYPKSNAMSWAVSFGSSHNQMLLTLERLTTPISYLTGGSAFSDPFRGTKQYHQAGLNQVENISDTIGTYGTPEARPEQIYRYIARGRIDTQIWNQPADINNKALWYLLESCGPDGHYHRMGFPLNNVGGAARIASTAKALYDATNGTVSRGSIWRSGGGAGRGDWFKEMVQQTY